MPPLAQMIVMQRYAGVDNNAADNSARQAPGTVHSFVLNTGLHLYTACTKERFVGLWIRVKFRTGSSTLYWLVWGIIAKFVPAEKI